MDPQPNLMSMLVPYALIALIFYFLVFKPQKDKQKELKNMIAGLQKHDEVVTTGGIHGTVVIIKEQTVVLRIDNNSRMEVEKDSIARVKTTKEQPVVEKKV